MPARKKPKPISASVMSGRLFVEISRKKQIPLPRAFIRMRELRLIFPDSEAQTSLPAMMTSQVTDTSVVAYVSLMTPVFCRYVTNQPLIQFSTPR